MKRRKIIGLVVFAFVLLSNRATAQSQNNKENQLPAVKETYVTFKLHSEVKLAGKDGTQLPTEVTNFIDNQESLATLHVDLKNINKFGYMRMSYVFPDMQDYQQWRSNDATEAFIQFLQQNTDREIEMRISMVRTPLNEFIKYTDLN